MTIAKITKAYIRHYSDNGQSTAYVEWVDSRGKAGRTEATRGTFEFRPYGDHMDALLDRAKREGITVERETW
jgi:hypothetical protein